jgi:ABC-type maltose transport system permease subunit
MTTSESPYRGADPSAVAITPAEARQSKESLAGVFDTLVTSNLRFVTWAKRSLFVTTACVVFTTAASVSTTVGLYNSRAENKELIAALKLCTKH